MPLSFRRGRVTAVTERRQRLVRLEVDGRACLAYPRLTGPVALGDDVVVNTQSVDLALGSGGFDVLAVNLTRGLGLAPEPGAHVMKLPYTPIQIAVRHGEETMVEAETSSLAGLPVVCCSLHSQLAPVCAGVGRDRKVAYLQLAGGALPVSLSDAVRALQRAGLVDTTVAVGACVDADVACVSTPSALLWTAAQGYDVVVCAIGPGIVGTGTRLGHGALSAAEAANAAGALGACPIVVPRLSLSDPRGRHRGVSHHTSAVLDLTLAKPTVAWPSGYPAPDRLDVETVDVDGWEQACEGLPLETMGRGPDEEPWLFAAAFAAGALAREWSS